MKPAKIYSLEQNALGITIVHSAGTFFFKTNEILSIEYRNRFFSKIKKNDEHQFWFLAISVFLGLIFNVRSYPEFSPFFLAIFACIFSYLLARTLYFFSRRDYFDKDIILITLLNNQCISLIDSKEDILIKTIESAYHFGSKTRRVHGFFKFLEIDGKEFGYGERKLLEWIWGISIVVIILTYYKNWPFEDNPHAESFIDYFILSDHTFIEKFILGFSMPIVFVSLTAAVIIGFGIYWLWPLVIGVYLSNCNPRDLIRKKTLNKVNYYTIALTYAILIFNFWHYNSTNGLIIVSGLIILGYLLAHRFTKDVTIQIIFTTFLLLLLWFLLLGFGYDLEILLLGFGYDLERKILSFLPLSIPLLFTVYGIIWNIKLKKTDSIYFPIYKNHKPSVKRWLKENPLLLKDLPKKWSESYEAVQTAIRVNPVAFEFASEEIKNDQEFIKEEISYVRDKYKNSSLDKMKESDQKTIEILSGYLRGE